MPALPRNAWPPAICLAVAAVSCTAGPAARSQGVPGVTNTAIRIGVEAETNAFASDEENLGMRLVARDVNDRGGVHGRRLELHGYGRSGGPSTDEAVANVRRLVEEDGAFLVFNHGGPASVPIATYAMSKRVPYMFPHTALITTDADRYVFTSYPRYLGETQVMLRYLVETRGLTRLGIVHDENVYGRFFLNQLHTQTGRFGYRVAGALALRERKPADLRDGVAGLRQASPEAVWLALYPEQARAVMDAKAKLGWGDVRMVASGPLTDEQYLNVPGGFAEGTLGFCYYPDPNSSQAPGVVEYRRLMAQYYPGRAMNRYSLYGYVFGRLVVEGLSRAGRPLTRETFVQAMESIRDWDSGGIMPPVTFTSANHHAQRAGFICELRDGRFEPLGGWVEP